MFGSVGIRSGDVVAVDVVGGGETISGDGIGMGGSGVAGAGDRVTGGADAWASAWVLDPMNAIGTSRSAKIETMRNKRLSFNANDWENDTT